MLLGYQNVLVNRSLIFSKCKLVSCWHVYYANIDLMCLTFYGSGRQPTQSIG